MNLEIYALTLLVIAAAIGAAAFYAGWRSAHAYLEAARAVSGITNVAIAQSQEGAAARAEFAAALDKSTAACASFSTALEKHTEATNERMSGMEGALVELFAGFERAGFVRAKNPAPGRQVGEPPAGS